MFGKGTLVLIRAHISYFVHDNDRKLVKFVVSSVCVHLLGVEEVAMALVEVDLGEASRKGVVAGRIDSFWRFPTQRDRVRLPFYVCQHYSGFASLHVMFLFGSAKRLMSVCKRDGNGFGVACAKEA